MSNGKHTAGPYTTATATRLADILTDTELTALADAGLVNECDPSSRPTTALYKVVIDCIGVWVTMGGRDAGGGRIPFAALRRAASKIWRNRYVE